MTKKQLLTELNKSLAEWIEILEEQGEDWDGYERQSGEIDGLKHAIDLVMKLK